MIVGKPIYAVVCALGLASFASQQVTSAQQPAAPPVVDLQGDPVPAGARLRLGSVRWRHPAAVNFIGFAADGKQLVTGCVDGQFRVWDLATGKQLRRFGKPLPAGAGGGALVLVGAGAALAPDGGTLAAQNPGASVSLWDVATGKELRTLGGPNAPLPNGPVSTAFAPDGKSVAVRQIDGSIRLYGVADGKPIRAIANAAPIEGLRVMCPSGIGRLTFTPDGKTLTVCAMGFEQARVIGVLLMHDVANNAPTRVVKGPVNVFADSSALSPDGKLVAWSTGDGRIQLYDAASGKEAMTLGMQQPSYQGKLLFAADGKTLISRPITNTGINVWDVTTGKVVRVLAEPGGTTSGVPLMPSAVAQAFGPDGKTIAEGLTNGCVRFWDVATGRTQTPDAGHQGAVERVTVTADGKTVVSIGADATVRRWDLATGKETSRFTLPAANVTPYLAANGTLVAFGAPNNEIKLWDAVAGKQLHAINVPIGADFAGTVGAAGGLDFTADGKRFAVRSADGITRIFDVATAKELAVCEDKAVVVAPSMVSMRGQVVFSGDGRTLVSLVRSSTGVAQICLWDAQTGKAIRRFDANRRIVALALSPDGRIVASTNLQNSISVWEVLSGKECLTVTFPLYEGGEAAKPGEAMMKPPHGPSAHYYDLSFAPDGRSLMVASGDDRVRWIALPSGEVGVAAGHTGPVQCLALSPDGKSVVSGGVDSTALVWDSTRYLRPAPVLAGPLAAAQVEKLWTALAGEPKEAYKAVNILSEVPEQAVRLFAAKLRPTPGIDGAELDRLIAALESNDFDTREKASRALEKIGDRAQPALQKVLNKRPALETQQRIERLLDHLNATGQNLSPEVLRNLRAVQLLEQAATPEAKQLLRTLAKGAPGDKLTQQAEIAVNRLGK